jgi:hypothetical protein
LPDEDKSAANAIVSSSLWLAFFLHKELAEQLLI